MPQSRLATILLFFELLMLLIYARFLQGGREKITFQQPSRPITDDELLFAKHVGRTVSRIARYVPLGFTCLYKSQAVRYCLERRGIPSTIKLGVVNEDRNDFIGHAWLEVGDGFVVVGPSVKDARSFRKDQ